MLAITEQEWRHAPNGIGQYTHSAEQHFRIEQKDVGITRPNYRGEGHSTYTFKASDVGRVVSVYTDRTNWTCWVFSSKAVQS